MKSRNHELISARESGISGISQNIIIMWEISPGGAAQGMGIVRSQVRTTVWPQMTYYPELWSPHLLDWWEMAHLYSVTVNIKQGNGHWTLSPMRTGTKSILFRLCVLSPVTQQKSHKCMLGRLLFCVSLASHSTQLCVRSR